MRRHHGRSRYSPFAGRTAPPLSADVSLVRSFISEITPSRPVRQSPLATSQIQGMPLDLIDRIRSFPLFQATPDSFLAEIGLLLKPLKHAPHDYIITEGDDAKAMYWLVRGAVAVTSRDGESIYAELKPGAFFGEIGILMDRPRTATVVATTRCLLVVLKQEDLRKILPAYPEVERAIREEAQERLTILEKKKRLAQTEAPVPGRRGSKRGSEGMGDEIRPSGNELGANGANKKRKSPGPGLPDLQISSALANGLVNVRSLLKELPFFASLPPEMLHFLGLNAQPQIFPPFTDIIKQDYIGREIYFIVRGEVEVLDEKHAYDSVRRNGRGNLLPQTPYVKARLRSGQYFGEVVSLALADRRTATVRSISSVECLMISSEVLDEFWARCPPKVRQQIEETARQRLLSASGTDVLMDDTISEPDIDVLAIGEQKSRISRRKLTPRVTLNDRGLADIQDLDQREEGSVLQPLDPDPFTGFLSEKGRSRSRRSSLAPISPEEVASDGDSKSMSSRSSPRGSPGGTPQSSSDWRGTNVFTDRFAPSKRRKPKSRPSRTSTRGAIPDTVLVHIFQNLDLHELVQLRAVSLHWQNLLKKSPELFHLLDLSRYNRRITDEVLTKSICPLVGPRPRVIDISNCFHITDEGFACLASTCGTNVKIWRMKSVWDVTSSAILEMANTAKSLQEIDLSNCRKVSDTLLARVVGWVVPHSPIQHHSLRPRLNTKLSPTQSSGTPKPGTVFGCPELKSLTLSYCKHVTDRSMHHIASHAASRIEYANLTRCTSITDIGFQYWGNAQFSKLRRLCLADCTYLTDNAIISLTNAAKGLQELDLSFCCALSDTATEVLALGCPNLRILNLSFCGSAVSDPSLRSIGLHLTGLRELSVRGCVRVTGTGVEVVVEGCHKLRVFDVSQCKNLIPWLNSGAGYKYGDKLKLETIAQSGRLLR